MLTDIEIVKKSKMNKISDVIKNYDIKEEELYHYGPYMAKLDLSIFDRLKDKKDGKLILVTAITPTPTGEGKSTTTIGLVDAMNKIGKKCVGAIREPSLGPVFGIKGGAAGGGYAQVNPMVDLNLHFTGDLHAMTTANNLVSAVIDNYLYQGNPLNIDPNRITWKRCMDLNDRALRKVEVSLSSKKEVKRYDYFNITVASEIMAMVCLSTSLHNLRERLDRTVVAYDTLGKEITIKDLGITGSLMVLLKDAIKPNIIQTLENNLIFAHGGPFANIAHGCNSILATRLALKVSDYVVTEAGFGADLGAEKFLDIKCREAGLKPNAVVMVATIKALKYHGGKAITEIKEEDVEALKKGLANLDKHIETIRSFNLPVVVAINRFLTDTKAEVDVLYEWAKSRNVDIALSEVYEKGSQGGIELAKKVVEACKDVEYTPLYNLDDSVYDKIYKIASKAYGASNITYSDIAKATLDKIDSSDMKDYYICMAKTPNSLTDDAKIIGRPKDFTINIKEVRISTGSKFIICLTGAIMTMPGLSKEPMALKIDMDDNMEVFGLM
ncbi:MAG: formate--tetrahydrofolate ligase [Bacilli bacterium]|nr:formate--tetrahydrofolate ligase [Bacilli bacterium]